MPQPSSTRRRSKKKATRKLGYWRSAKAEKPRADKPGTPQAKG